MLEKRGSRAGRAGFKPGVRREQSSEGHDSGGVQKNAPYRNVGTRFREDRALGDRIGAGAPHHRPARRSRSPFLAGKARESVSLVETLLINRPGLEFPRSAWAHVDCLYTCTMQNLAFSRNLRDGLLIAVFPLPALAGTSASGTIDLEDEELRPEQVGLQFDLPALSTTIVPDTRTVSCAIESSTTSNFSVVDQTLFAEVFTGADGVGIAAKLRRARLPCNCARYLRFKVTFGASTTDGSALNATFTLRF